MAMGPLYHLFPMPRRLRCLPAGRTCNVWAAVEEVWEALVLGITEHHQHPGRCDWKEVMEGGPDHCVEPSQCVGMCDRVMVLVGVAYGMSVCGVSSGVVGRGLCGEEGAGRERLFVVGVEGSLEAISKNGRGRAWQWCDKWEEPSCL